MKTSSKKPDLLGVDPRLVRRIKRGIRHLEKHGLLSNPKKIADAGDDLSRIHVKDLAEAQELGFHGSSKEESTIISHFWSEFFARRRMI